MISVYTLAQSNQWDSIVRSFSNYDTYWLSGYVKAFFLHGDGNPLLFYYEKDGTRGINVVMERDISNDERFKGRIEQGRFIDYATPYGYGGWIVEGNGIDELFDEYESLSKKRGAVSEFVRFHPLLQNHTICKQYYDVVELGEVVHMELDSPESIWANITSKNRNMIRKAKKNGVEIFNGRYPEIFETFRNLYDSTMDKDGADKYYYFNDDFYRSILNDLSGNAQVFYAEKDNIIISAAIVLAANGKMNYHLSGSLKEYSSFAPTNLLLYEVAIWGFLNGYKTFYLGGGLGSGEDSLFRFKRSFFRGDLKRFYIGKRIIDREKYEELVGMRNPVESEFFPKYRA